MAIDYLTDGYKSFRKRMYDDCVDGAMSDLSVKGQKPHAMIISCCDSRVDPSIIFDCSPGDIFVKRNVANLVPPHHVDLPGSFAAALEFAVLSLKIADVMVMGHSQCGGIEALSGDVAADELPCVHKWIGHFQHLADKGLKNRDLEIAAVQESCKNLRSYQCVKGALQSGQLKVHGFYFDIKSGDLIDVTP